MQTIAEKSSQGNLAPVFFCSPLPESNYLDWQGGVDKTYLYAPFVAYPVPNAVLPLPYRLTQDAKEDVSTLLDTRLAHSTEVLFVTHQTNDASWVPWMTMRMSQAGFTGRLEKANNYTVLVFRRRV
jgi:hypothetical protein